ncbi:MAG: septum site-determining protein MinC [Clostridia bacterium]|nr:septum site-determining protein MinC [Clostridia bacterium]
MKKSCISINLKKDKILIKIDEDSEQKDIVDSLRKKLPELKKFYKEEKNPIKVTGKVLKNKEIYEIQNLIKEAVDVEIDFDMPKSLGLSSIKKTFEREIATSETKFHKGSLRSGQKIETEGSLVVLGDVNSGAEVVASDNIVVLGALRGLAHAGAKGNKQAIIAAGLFDSVQIRIANIVREIVRDEEPMHKQAYISVIDDKIVIE